MKNLASLFVGIAGAGLVLSLFVHITALAGIESPLGRAAWALHGGIFLVWLPAVLAAQRLTTHANRADMWRMALRGCPPWMKYLTYFFFGYAFLNFAFFVIRGFSRKPTEIESLRGFSGHWMLFYGAAMAILYSYIKEDDRLPRCANGHICSQIANYCERCGQAVQRTAP